MQRVRLILEIYFPQITKYLQCFIEEILSKVTGDVSEHVFVMLMPSARGKAQSIYPPSMSLRLWQRMRQTERTEKYYS